MSCATCDHTLQCVAARADGMDRDIYWCPRCGTISDGRHISERPKLVERCRAFAGGMRRRPDPRCGGAEVFDGLTNIWNIVGVAEAINKPEDRT